MGRVTIFRKMINADWSDTYIGLPEKRNFFLGLKKSGLEVADPFLFLKDPSVCFGKSFEFLMRHGRVPNLSMSSVVSKIAFIQLVYRNGFSENRGIGISSSQFLDRHHVGETPHVFPHEHGRFPDVIQGFLELRDMTRECRLMMNVFNAEFTHTLGCTASQTRSGKTRYRLYMPTFNRVFTRYDKRSFGKVVALAIWLTELTIGSLPHIQILQYSRASDVQSNDAKTGFVYSSRASNRSAISDAGGMLAGLSRKISERMGIQA